MRALHADSPSWSLFGLVVAALLIVAWALWFFLAPLALHETGQLSHVTATGAVVATFSLEGAKHIRSGQSAALVLQDSERGPPLPAVVTNVKAPVDAKRLEVELYPRSRTGFASLSRALASNRDGMILGQAMIEIARATPAMVLIRTLTASPNSIPNPSAR